MQRMFRSALFYLGLINIMLWGLTKNTEASHFTKIWDGENGFGHMNIYVVTATIDGEALQANDEIAAFSGDLCVGSIVLEEQAGNGLINLITSLDDGTGNDFVNGDTILLKVWDASASSEYIVTSINYRSDLSTWRRDGKYMFNESSFVDLSVLTQFIQKIQLNKGWNIFSGYVLGEDPDMLSVLDSMVQAGALERAIDENGSAVENLGSLGGWVNNIGDMQQTEGYKIKVKEDVIFNLWGHRVDVPVLI